MTRSPHPRRELLDIYLEIVDELWIMPEQELIDLADSAGVHKSTLYNWKYRYVAVPRLSTFFKVTSALGYRIELVRGRSMKRRAA